MPLKLSGGYNTVKIPSNQKNVSKKKHLIDKSGFTYGKSYTTNTSKEETVLEYVEDFRRQFVQVFPDRRPLLLCPKNEAGVRKFVCTTVRPTLLPYDSVYDLQDCANFVADFLTYLPMDEPTDVPDLLPSPATTVRLRAGDSLDFANLLCSLLRGNGFNAYVVSGYAPEWVTTQSQHQTICPLLESTAMPKHEMDGTSPEEASEDNDAAIKPASDEGAEGSDVAKKLKYQLKVQPSKESKFIALKANHIQQEEDEKTAETLRKAQYEMIEHSDPLEGNRVHFWVLVMPGRRDVQEATYVEPTTGTIWTIPESPYLGVESVWNEKNYWVNVQTCKPKKISFDLASNDLWEYVLIDEKKVQKETEDTGMNFDSVNEDNNDDTQLSPEEAFDDRDILDCPVSWCDRIIIDRQKFTEAYPGGSKRLHYKQCTVEKFCKYFEGASGLVLRVTIYQTDDCITPIEVREFFKARQDKLYKRYTFPLEDRVHEFFEPGRPHGLKEFIRVEDTKRYFTFYWSSREDGMASRDEHIGVKVIERFEGRDDFVIYRSVAVEPASVNPQGRNKYGMIKLARGGRGEGSDGRGEEAPVRKVTEKFARNPRKPASQDVRKRTYFISEGTIRLDYHYSSRAITASSLTLDKQDKQIGSDALAAELNGDYAARNNDPNRGQHKELLTKLVQREKELLSKCRDRESNIDELLSTLQSEAQRVDNLEKSIYDVAHEQSNVEDHEKQEGEIDEEKDKNRVDYLSPFLAQYPSNKPLTRRQAMTAKDECLATLKERLLERANIILNHLDSENQKLQQRRQMFKRQTGSGAVDADEVRPSQVAHITPAPIPSHSSTCFQISPHEQHVRMLFENTFLSLVTHFLQLSRFHRNSPSSTRSLLSVSTFSKHVCNATRSWP